MSETKQEEVAANYPEKPAPVAHPIDENMQRRWSPRLFAKRPVEREKILSLLEAARWAPSCYNDQPWYYLVFDGADEEALRRARSCLAPGNHWATHAPLLLLSVAREHFNHNSVPNRHAQHDTGAASAYLVLQAVELGLRAHQMAGFDAEQARTEFDIPNGYMPMAMIAVGYPYEGDVKALDEKERERELAERQRRHLSETAFAGDWNVPF
jgi:nitroreductase